MHQPFHFKFSIFVCKPRYGEYEFCNAQKIYLYVFKLLDLTYIIKNSPRFINYFSLPVENFPLSQR